jgi:hypothetical protein
MVDRGWSGGAPWTHGGADRGHGGTLTGAWPPDAPVRQSSPAGAQKGERSTGSSARASPELGRRWVAGGDGRKRPRSVGAVGKTHLTCEARLTERRGRGGRLGRARTEKENVFPMKTRPTRGLDGPARTVSACGDGAAGGRAGPEDERAARLAGPKARKKNFRIKIGFLNSPRLWKFVEGDLGGILT